MRRICLMLVLLGGFTPLAQAGMFTFNPINALTPTGAAAVLSTVIYDVPEVGEKTFKLPDPYAPLSLTHDAGVAVFTTEQSGIIDITIGGQTLPFQQYLDANGAWYVNSWDLTSIVAVSTDGLAVLGLGKPHGQQWYGSQFSFLATYAPTYAVPEPQSWILSLAALIGFGVMTGGAALSLHRQKRQSGRR